LNNSRVDEGGVWGLGVGVVGIGEIPNLQLHEKIRGGLKERSGGEGKSTWRCFQNIANIAVITNTLEFSTDI